MGLATIHGVVTIVWFGMANAAEAPTQIFAAPDVALLVLHLASAVWGAGQATRCEEALTEFERVTIARQIADAPSSAEADQSTFTLSSPLCGDPRQVERLCLLVAESGMRERGYSRWLCVDSQAQAIAATIAAIELEPAATCARLAATVAGPREH